MTKWRRRNRTPVRGDWLRRWFFWAFLTVSVVTVTATRGHDSAWPMIGWTMYWRIGETPEVIHVVRIDVETTDGNRRSFFPPDPLTHVERPLVENVMWQAFNVRHGADESRRFLLRLLNSRLSGSEIDSVWGYRLEWDVPSPPRLRRFSRDEPDRTIALGGFAAESYR